MKIYKIRDENILEPVDTNKAIESILDSINNQNIVFFFGAGVSAEYPTLLPVAGRLEKILRNMLLKNLAINLSTEASAELNGLKLEFILDYFCRTLGDEALKFYDVIKAKCYRNYSPNFRHYFLASMAKEGYCKYFITVNFDTACEDAFNRLNVPYIVPEGKKEQEKRFYSSDGIALEKERSFIFKLHGTINELMDPNNTRLLATVERVGIGLPSYKQKFLEEISKKYEIFFIGYNSEQTDIDVFPIFAKTNSSQKIFWYVYGDVSNVCEKIRLFIYKRNGYIISGNLDDILISILNKISIDFKPLLAKIGVDTIREIENKEKDLNKIRENEINNFVQDYTLKYFSSSVPAYLILANIMQKPKLWKISEDLLSNIGKMLPETDFNLRYVYSSNLAEVNRSIGNLSEAIKTREKALEYLRSANYEETTKIKHAIHQIIRNGSDYIGLFKSSFNQFRNTKKVSVLIFGIKNFAFAILSFFEASRRINNAKKKMDEFDKWTLQSMLNFEVADFFQFTTEGLFYMGLLVRSKSKMAFLLLKSLTIFPAFISEFFYRRSVEKIPTQSSDWFFFQKNRLAEVIMHRKRKVTSEVDQMIKELDTFYGWGKSPNSSNQFPETEGGANLGVCYGIKLYYENRPNCIDVLRNAYNTYKTEEHYSGMFKAKLYLSICYEKEGKTELLQRELFDIANILKKYK